MIGPPGSGKSMLAARLPTILPTLTPAELLEVSMIASVAGEIEGGALTNRRPFRSPHHSASMPALVGGGLRAKPGEVSLAHHGVLFLDEMPEFQAQVLDALRQPLETGEVAIARANHRVTYPARFMLVAAMNPCRCGRANDPGFACRRGPNARCAAEYQTRLSGPLLDRIDLNIEVPAVTAADLILPPPAEGSREVAARVAQARAIQAERYAALGLCRRHHQCRGAAAGAGGGGAAGQFRACFAARRRRRHAAVGARLSPGVKGGAHAGRSRRRRESRPRASGRGVELPRAGRRGAAGGVSGAFSVAGTAQVSRTTEQSGWLAVDLETPGREIGGSAVSELNHRLNDRFSIPASHNRCGASDRKFENYFRLVGTIVEFHIAPGHERKLALERNHEKKDGREREHAAEADRKRLLQLHPICSRQ